VHSSVIFIAIVHILAAYSFHDILCRKNTSFVRLFQTILISQKLSPQLPKSRGLNLLNAESAVTS
jgi:hypothetical protein